MGLARTVYENAASIADSASLSCLQNLDTKQLYDVAQKIALVAPTFNKYAPAGFAPVADGVEIGTHPFLAIARNEVADVPVISGSNTDEGWMFTPPDMYNATEAQVNELWTNGGFPAEVLDALYFADDIVYPDVAGYSRGFFGSERAMGDYSFACGSKYVQERSEWRQGEMRAARLQPRIPRSPFIFSKCAASGPKCATCGTKRSTSGAFWQTSLATACSGKTRSHASLVPLPSTLAHSRRFARRYFSQHFSQTDK